MFEGIIDSFLSLALSIAEYISAGVYAIVVCILYPLQVGYYWITSIIGIIWNSFTSFFAAFYQIHTILYNHVSSTIITMFPSTWTVIVLLGLTIVGTLRLYYFIKDVSILGFKI